MSSYRLLVGLLAVSAFAADSGLEHLLKQVEGRYNHAKTLQVQFKEDYTALGQRTRTESGTLLLRKPGRMRWAYSQPQGKLFISDGKNVWLYLPDDNRVERMSLKDTGDMRAPLAFLLGKLHFDKEFRNVQATPEGNGFRITAEPKADSLPYSRVEFLVSPDYQIRQVKVTGFDKSILDFTFNEEKMDPPLDAKLFEFQPPPGVTVEEDQ
ncbi:MAG TPA: outer membrane lipoprotein carrier protein LolA [Bryobacteraceae bacterium]|nr:outer membrane lipoprotein carrier protein LolA [Bryobacteraceae bacterium]